MRPAGGPFLRGCNQFLAELAQTNEPCLEDSVKMKTPQEEYGIAIMGTVSQFVWPER